MNKEAESVTQHQDARLTMPEEFDNASEALPQRAIVVISPEDYSTLANLSHEEARELPDSLYLVDETIRDRLAEAGVTYDMLNSAVLSSVEANAYATSDEDGTVATGEKLLLGKESSAHQVFFGSIRINSPESENGSISAAIAIKPHHEQGVLSAKPFKEVGNLALLQSLGHEGIYKPVGVLKKGDHKFVLTEGRTGVKTFDGHEWFGWKSHTSNRLTMTPDQRDALHSTDIELVARALEMLGDVHGQGVFHLDAQMKNIGWVNVAEVEQKKGVDAKEASKTSRLGGVKLTLVDLENAQVFGLQNKGDFEQSYYDNLAELALTDINQFVKSVPIRSRVPRGHVNGDSAKEGYEELYAELYLDAFFASRGHAITGADEDSELELRSQLRSRIVDKLKQLNNPVSDRVGRAERFRNVA